MSDEERQELETGAETAAANVPPVDEEPSEMPEALESQLESMEDQTADHDLSPVEPGTALVAQGEVYEPEAVDTEPEAPVVDEAETEGLAELAEAPAPESEDEVEGASDDGAEAELAMEAEEAVDEDEGVDQLIEPDAGLGEEPAAELSAEQADEAEPEAIEDDAAEQPAEELADEPSAEQADEAEPEAMEDKSGDEQAVADQGQVGMALDEDEGAPASDVPDDDRLWYVIHCYSGQENKVRHNLEQRIDSMGMKDRIFDVVVPTEEEIEVKDGKRRTVERRVFPGYILVQMILSEDSWYVVRNTPGVTGFVGMGNEPTPLRPEEVSQIIKRMEAEAPRIKVTYKIGQKVRIIDGPFNDFIGTVDDIDMERAKVRVMVSFFGRETPVELDFLQVEKA